MRRLLSRWSSGECLIEHCVSLVLCHKSFGTPSSSTDVKMVSLSEYTVIELKQSFTSCVHRYAPIRYLCEDSHSRAATLQGLLQEAVPELKGAEQVQGVQEQQQGKQGLSQGQQGQSGKGQLPQKQHQGEDGVRKGQSQAQEGKGSRGKKKKGAGSKASGEACVTPSAESVQQGTQDQKESQQEDLQGQKEEGQQQKESQPSQQKAALSEHSASRVQEVLCSHRQHAIKRLAEMATAQLQVGVLKRLSHNKDAFTSCRRNTLCAPLLCCCTSNIGMHALHLILLHFSYLQLLLDHGNSLSSSAR